MAFRGFTEQPNGDALLASAQEDEDLAVYNWDDDTGYGYDALDVVEDDDDLNDETFGGGGGGGSVGRDFDFGHQPAVVPAPPPSASKHQRKPSKHAPPPAPAQPQPGPSKPAPPRNPSLDAILKDNSVHSVLGGIAPPLPPVPPPARRPLPQHTPSPHRLPSSNTLPALTSRTSQPRIRTLQEIEAEMLASQQAPAPAFAAPNLAVSQSLPHMHQQHHRQPEMPSYPPELERFAPIRAPGTDLGGLFQPSGSRTSFAPDPRPSTASYPADLSLPPLGGFASDMSLPPARSYQHEMDLRLPPELMSLPPHQQGPYDPSPYPPPQPPQPPPQREMYALEDLERQFTSAPPLQVPPPNYALEDLERQMRAQQLEPPLPLPLPPQPQPQPQASEQLLRNAMSTILATEAAEAARRRKAAKLSRMAPRNELMSQRDKDFITRIQVSQLVSADPYADDFYAQVFGAIVRARVGDGREREAVISFGEGGGVGVGIGRGAGRRENAMARMRQQVERLVMSARAREKEKGAEQTLKLQHTLGRLVNRGAKTTPRPLLAGKQDSFAAAAAASPPPAMPGAAKDGSERRPPLTQRQVLMRVEALYDIVMQLEQARRDQPPAEEAPEEAIQQWNEKYAALAKNLWDELHVMDPLDISDPHPMISLLTPAKGKKLLPRALRHLSQKESLTVVTLLIACFSQLDVVRMPADRDERQTEVFLASVLPCLIGALRRAGLRLVSGLLGHLIARCNVVEVARTRPGLELLTMFLAQAEGLKHAPPPDTPAPDELDHWHTTYNRLFAALSPALLTLFPSTRRLAALPFGPAQYVRPTPADDRADQPTWQFLAALAVSASMGQQQLLVAELREKVLENVMSERNGLAVSEEEARVKIGNVNLFLNALGIDSSQIQM